MRNEKWERESTEKKNQRRKIKKENHSQPTNLLSHKLLFPPSPNINFINYSQKMFSATSRQLLRTSIRSYFTQTATTTAAVRPKKVGAFRGGFIGFLLGVTTTGSLSYYYLLDQYNLSNTVVVSDIIALQNSISNLEKHIKTLEEKK